MNILNLYPVFYQEITNETNEVTAEGPGNTVISLTAERNDKVNWTGSVTIEIYRDGEKATNEDNNTIYFRYGSDNTADITLTLKRLDEEGNEIPSTSDEDWEFTINGILAHQSGSSPSGTYEGGGLKYDSNYVTEYDGKLDNVMGDSTIRVYMSTRYKAEFYLDGEELTVPGSGSEKAYYEGEHFTPDGSVGTFNGHLSEESKESEDIYIVASGNNSSIVEVGHEDGPEEFLTKPGEDTSGYYTGPDNSTTIAHGGDYLFGYIVKTYEHGFDLPDLAKHLPAGVDTTTGWIIAGKNVGSFDGAKNFTITGGDNGTTKYANSDSIFRFNAYTFGNLTIEKKVAGGDDSGRKFDFSVELTFPESVYDVINKDGDTNNYDVIYKTNDSKTVTVTATIGDGESFMVTNIPTTTTYAVTEKRVAGYVPDAVNPGTITTGANNVTVTNRKTEKDEYTVSYVVQGETPPDYVKPDDEIVAAGDTYNVASTPDDVTDKDGSGNELGTWQFDGWYRDGSIVTSPFEMPEQDVTLTGRWTYTPKDAGSNPSSPGSPNPVKPSTPADPKPSAPTTPPALNTDDHFAYIVGYEGGIVRPEANITRAEVATIFFRLLTDEVRDQYWSSTNSYPDVSADAWYNIAISTMTHMGIVGGYPDGTFRPDANITRAELTKIAVMFFNYEGKVTKSTFTDVASHWAENLIIVAENFGLIHGYEDGTFRPNANITRAETMAIVNRVLGRKPNKDHLHGSMAVWSDNLNTGAWYYADVQEATNAHDFDWIEVGGEKAESWTEILPSRDWAALEKRWKEENAIK